MTERRAFPSPPNKNNIAEKDSTVTLPWAQWFGIVAMWMQRVRVISVDIDWPSIPAGAYRYAEVTIPGVRIGDFAAASTEPGDRDIGLVATVTADNTVTVWAMNFGPGAVDLAAGTLRVRVEKAR